MTTVAARGGGERRADDAADFLRRLSIADAKVLLERTRKEKENKTKEMQKMIGVRYRDLIESADKIVNMHSAALRLEVSLKEMPEKWKQMELALASALAVGGQDEDAGEEKTDTAAVGLLERALSDDATDADKVAFLVEVPEQMWQLLDEGESLKVLELYQRATKIHDECVTRAAEQEFPFLQTQWACIQCFRPRMVTCAKSYLTCRGKESRFYADNLCTLAVLSDPPIGAKKLFEVFLESRSKWMTPIHKKGEEHATQSSAKKERSLMIILNAISMTMAQTEDIFGDGSASGLLGSISQLSVSFKDELEEFISSGKMFRLLSDWFQRKRRQIFEVAVPIISSIDSISLLSQVQSKLYAVNKTNGGCLNVKLWARVVNELAESREKKLSASVESVFTILFAEAFRKRTRDLVQHSFVEALEAIKSQIRASLEDTATRISRSDFHLRNVKFYDYFETIQKKAADLDASDLQSVLIEEFLRTLFKLVVFFEQEYPLPESRNAGAVNQAPSVFLSISNILAGIVAGFHRQTNKLFPGTTTTVSIPERDSSLLTVDSSFEKYSSDGFVTKTQFKSALEEILEGGESALACFIDEELRRVDALGFHSLYLVSEIKRKTSYPQLFVNVLHGLSKKYCEAWATILLKQKIEPLRELMQIEQYDATNEEWIATHEGWIEQVISDEGLGGDTDDSSSESEMALGDEKLGRRESVGSERYWDKRRTDQIDAAYHSRAKATQKDSVLNFGECCIQQFLFDMYFVRATLGFSDFIRFGWGDELNPEECSPGLLELKSLFERMREFIDPVDWEIYGPQLIENVVLQFRKSRLLFSSLSESNDINKINGKEIVIGAQDTRPLARIAEPVARFSLLPVPSNRRKFQRTMSSMSRSSEDDTAEGRSRTNSSTLFHERSVGDDTPQSSAMKLQNLLSSSASSNIFSAATSGTNLLSSAAKGIGFLSSATTNKYF
ncbi:hypothetical protein PF005_g187 [Phytophthora fragariae]|uniref:Conserved oligomeric Golgi complex subunit 1 n=1 Tax=Phytophthora fragariae TaxID=53985 RepID=A0A6A3FYF2_9STRA|nr:hypothetical protein PF009_g186 [Phytophthora fragariae]KAE9030427.1 hypothetical protein PF011_g608 [Phytophthora fragariae]KAE9140501.1 hypothetical protein PF010_g181 [Phytophthora fragariae]KAE9141495.1 hypothetical protein PF007_g186 [Phytophthora fragariae]KAE9155329.1 hypothetical protein PF006_g725 [Phytophthora fragariae]